MGPICPNFNCFSGSKVSTSKAIILFSYFAECKSVNMVLKGGKMQ